jgi:aldehyde:ferredoxin oxidoreductase
MMSTSYGWAGKLLFVDLSSGRIEFRDTAPYAAGYIGGHNVACRIGWDELPDGVKAFDPENMLTIITGPLTGTTAPFSGRTTVSGLSPQGWPHEWFSRSSIGGHWGPTLKYAGFDGLVIQGKAAEPVYLWIDDGRVEIRPAGHLWGLGIYETQQRLMEEHGRSTRILAIGQAGEHLSRIAIISTGTASSAGQGGYGGVMGSKNLKAIAVRGTGALYVARPDEFAYKSKAIAAEMRAPHANPRQPALDRKRVKKYGQKWQACTQQCTTPCVSARFYSHVRGPATGRLCKGQLHCVSQLFPGRVGTFYGWNLGFEAGFEVCTYANDWGLNHWDLLFGLIPWLRACVEAGYLTSLDGMNLDFDDPHFWIELFKKITFREGVGDLLAEGGRRTPGLLGFGEELAQPLYAAWGYAGHWDGHGDHANRIVFPYWLVTALQWAMDVRDPLNSGHGYAQNVMNWSPINSPKRGLSWDKIRLVGEKVYGSSLATDPESGYAYKAEPAVWHKKRSMLKDSLTVDDNVFPRLFSRSTEDGYARAAGMEGPQFEWHLFTAATGSGMSVEEFDRCAERAANLERTLQVRHFGRRRQDDEGIIPYLEFEENLVNPFLGRKQSLDREQFLKLMDRYYELSGWARETGWPGREKLTELGLEEVAERLYPGGGGRDLAGREAAG